MASSITLSVVWGVTGDLKLSSVVGGLDFLVKILAYYIHESSWGRSLSHEERNVEPSNNSRPH